MHSTANDIDILIVGAGPVGLFLANECARRGLRYRIIETHATQSQHSKALAIFPRTLEIFDMANVVAPFLAVANRVTSVAISVGDHQLGHMPFKPEADPVLFCRDGSARCYGEASGRGAGAPWRTRGV